MKGRRETERQSESKRKTRRRVCKRGREQHHLPSFFSSSESSGERRRGGSGANLYYICFIHVVDTRVISVYDHWTVADCSVWKRASSTAQPPPDQPPPSYSAPTIISVSFLCILMCSDLHCLLHHSPPCFSFSFVPSLLFLPLTLSLFLTSLLSPRFMSRWSVVSYRNRSSEKPPVTLRSQIAMNVCVCVCVTHCHHPQHNRGHTEFMFPAARAILTPGTFLS